MSDNQPQVGTCPMCSGNGRIYEHVQDDTGERCPSCRGSGVARVPHPTPAEPRIETVPDERAQAQNDWNKLLLEIARLYALIDDEWADADIGEMDEFDPWHALRELTKRMVGAQPEPDEREAQAEAVNKIWNQFRSGDGEEDCELYRALEQAYGAGRARAGSRAALAEWFFNNESEEQEADDRKHRQREQKYARWPEDAAIQPYCRWAWRRADAFIAHFERASPPSSPGAAQTPLIHWSMIGPPDEPAGACWEGDCYPDEPQKISTDIREVTCIECHKHYLTLNDLKRALSSGAQSRADDNLNSAVRQYRHAVHGMDCTCKDCTRLLKILVSDNYELSSPGAPQEQK